MQLDWYEDFWIKSIKKMDYGIDSLWEVNGKTQDSTSYAGTGSDAHRCDCFSSEMAAKKWLIFLFIRCLEPNRKKIKTFPGLFMNPGNGQIRHMNLK